MEDPKREDADSHYFHPGGVPVTPQARRFGYEFPVYVSTTVWAAQCISEGIASRHSQNLEKRIWHVLQACYDGMAKKLSVSDDFVYYDFKLWYWDREAPKASKQRRIKLGARLLLDPSTDGPWMYIFNPYVDLIDELEEGQPPAAHAPGQGEFDNATVQDEEEHDPWDSQEGHEEDHVGPPEPGHCPTCAAFDDDLNYRDGICETCYREKL